MPATASAAISVIVPVHNGGDKFRVCIQSLLGTRPAPQEIIVVADGETDGASNDAESAGARVFRLPVSRGPARARNVGAAGATGDILLFIDGDVAVRPDTIGKVAAAFTNDPELDAILGSYDDEPGAVNFLSQYKNLLHHYVHQTAREDASTFWGACGAIRREVFTRVGGFDESYRYPSIEDVELGYRLKQAGYRIKLCKDLQVKHLKHWRVFSLLQSDLLYRALPWTELTFRHGRLLNDLNLRLSGRISAVVACALAVSLLAGLWRTAALALAAALAGILLLVNAPLYYFFFRKRGFGFFLQAVPWHWLYYFYSAAAFALGAVLYAAGALHVRSRQDKTVAHPGRD